MLDKSMCPYGVRINAYIKNPSFWEEGFLLIVYKKQTIILFQRID